MKNIKNICATCGTWYGEVLPATCTICADDRQYIPENGQQWTSLFELQKIHSVRFSELHHDLIDMRIIPSFAIGQRAFLVITPSGNILWDCIPFIDAASEAFIHSKGGIRAIAVSHPHFYSSITEYAEVFDCAVYLHANDQDWIMNKINNIQLWEGNEKVLWDDIKIINTGGHFPGSAVLHLPHHGYGGSLLTGDSIYVCRDRKQVTCMYSYPNLIPLPKSSIEHVKQSVSGLTFDSIYGGFDFMNLTGGAKEIFEKSMKRYLEIF